MTLEDLANLGNAIGSLGIVITIGFLALEMRWTRMESKRQQRITLQQSVMDLELALMSNNAHVALNKWEAFSLESNDEMTKDQLREFFNDEELNEVSTSKNGTPFGWRSSFPAITFNNVAKSFGFFAIGPLVDSLCRYTSLPGSLGTRPHVGRIP